MKLYQHAKNKLIPLVNSISESRDQISHAKNETVSCYHHTKNETVSSIYSGEMVHLEILKSDWLRGFWHISQEQDFF